MRLLFYHSAECYRRQSCAKIVQKEVDILSNHCTEKVGETKESCKEEDDAKKTSLYSRTEIYTQAIL